MEATKRGTFVERSTPLVPRSPAPAAASAAALGPRVGCRFVVSAFNIRLVGKSCGKCRGKGAVECPGCKGSGRNKQNGNLFERWKCFDCQGFGLVSCPNCGKGGLTPEQRGER